MGSPRYTRDQLLHLRNSPLIQKPDNLPSIKQWCEQDPSQRKLREQAGQQNGRVDENESTKQQSRRPPLFERHSSRQQTGEDVYLGPKSFASARQSHKNEDDSKLGATLDDSRTRTAGRDKLRDREPRDRNRFEKLNGNNEDGRGFGSYRKGYDKKIEEDDEEAADEAEARRRAKLDQPWFRGERKVEDNLDEALEPSNDRGWRARGERRDNRDWQRPERVEQEPQWMAEKPVKADITLHTQDDFEKWKAAMKNADMQQGEEHEHHVTVASAPDDTFFGRDAKGSMPPHPANDLDQTDNVFSLWSGAKREEREDSLATPKTTSKPKSSRFAGFFGPSSTEQPPQPHHQPQVAQAPKPPSPSPLPAVQNVAPQQSGVRTSNEDQEGFQKLMAMLRMGGGSAQNAGIMPFPAPAMPAQPGASSEQASLPQRQTSGSISQPSSQPQSRHPASTSTPKQAPTPQSLPSAQHNASQHAPQPQRPPPAGSRDSEFLLKLMQQPRVPFAEGQIYGQSYGSRNDSAEITALLNNLNVKQGQPGPPPPGPPPGINSHERHLPQHVMQGQPRQSHMPMEERMHGQGMPGHHSRPGPPEEHRFQGPPGFEGAQFPPGMRPMPGMHPDSMAPPPGFAPPGRGIQAPPGYYPQHMRGPLPPQPGQYYQGPPPTAGPPPGFAGPPPPGMQRRPPSLQMPPGFDVYGGGDRRGMPMQGPPPAQYSQYMK